MSYIFYMIDPDSAAKSDADEDEVIHVNDNDVQITFNYAPIMYSDDCFGKNLPEGNWADHICGKTGEEVSKILKPIIKNLLWIGTIDHVTCNEANVKESLNELKEMCDRYPNAILVHC